MSVFCFKISVAKTVEKQHPRIEKALSNVHEVTNSFLLLFTFNMV